MKTNALKVANDGAVLLTTVCVLSVLTLMAVSYLFLLKDNNYLVARDQTWNRALVVAEAGVEEALAHINNQGATTMPPAYGSDNWTQSGTNYYVPALRTNLYGGTYNVLVFGGATEATIISTGIVSAPLLNGNLIRTVKVTAARTSGFDVGMESLLGVNLNGNNITIDSYDSSDTNDFPGGIYNAAHREAHGDVATLEDSGSALQLGNANIMGKLHTGPGGTEAQAAASLGPNGSVGDVAFVTGGSVGIETPTTNWFADDMNNLPGDVYAPYTNGYAPTAGATNTYLLSSGDYELSSLTLKTGDSLAVAPGSFAVLYVTGNINMSGQSTIDVPLGSQLIIYCAGASASFTTVNNAGNANSFQFLGLPSNTSLSWGGNASYVGTVYAPEASFTLGGGGKNTQDYQGACVVKQITMNGKFNFHYDQNLSREPGPGTFVPTSWQELTSK